MAMKRKLDIDPLSAFLRFIDDDAPPETYKEVIHKLKTMVDEMQPRKKARLEVIPSSSIQDLESAISLFGLDDQLGEEYVWEAPSAPDAFLSAEVDVVLRKMRCAKFWKTHTAANLSRAFIDLLIFDRLEAHQDELSSRNLVLRGEYQVGAMSPIKDLEISGKADYVLGYDPLFSVPSKQFESCSIIVQAKRKQSFDAGLGQAVAYMVGVHQHRKNLTDPKRIVAAVYGMVSDGLEWQFLRLDGNELQSSLRISGVVEEGRRRICRFVDAIIRAAISSTPHMSPESRFPATEARWKRNVETTIFGTRPRKLEEFLKLPTTAFLADDSESDMEDVEEFDIIRPGPS